MMRSICYHILPRSVFFLFFTALFPDKISSAFVFAVSLQFSSPGPWDVCSSYLNYTQYAPSVKEIYLALKGKMDILVYR